MRLILRHEGDREDGRGACRHEWPAAHIPMDAHRLGELLIGAGCPACGGVQGIKAYDVRESRVGETP